MLCEYPPCAVSVQVVRAAVICTGSNAGPIGSPSDGMNFNASRPKGLIGLISSEMRCFCDDDDDDDDDEDEDEEEEEEEEEDDDDDDDDRR